MGERPELVKSPTGSNRRDPNLSLTITRLKPVELPARRCNLSNYTAFPVFSGSVVGIDGT